jgi:hypothetical protein
MSGLRFSIANLLVAVTVIGVGLAALNSPSDVNAGILVVATLAALLAAVLGVVYCEGERRAFCLGAALFGGAYFAVAFTPAFSPANEHICDALRSFRAAFWTTRVPDGSDPFSKRTTGRDTEYDYSTKTTLARPSWHHGFGATAHCIALWLFALIGGIIGRCIYATSAATRKRQ